MAISIEEDKGFFTETFYHTIVEEISMNVADFILFLW